MPELEDLEHLNELIEKREKKVRSEAYKSGRRQGRKSRISKGLELAALGIYGAMLTPMMFERAFKEAIAFTFIFMFFIGLAETILTFNDHMD